VTESDNLRGIFAGLVEKTEDPEKLGRLKVRVPSVYGSEGGQGGYIGVDSLPWALPAGLPAGGSPVSGGMDWLPTVGDQVFVMFLDGEPEKPVWMWGMQTKPQVKKFPLHDYGPSLGSVGKPARGALTRYGHTVEWGPGTLIVTTSKGYRLSLSENATTTGQCLLTTPQGNQLSLDDSTGTGTISVNLDMLINAMAQFSVMAADIALSAKAGNAALDSTLESKVSGGVQATLTGPLVAIGTAETELLQTLNLLVLALGACTVVCSTPGSPSGPLLGGPGWAAVQAQLTRLQAITGTIAPVENTD